jgi:DNA-binding MarR family transcriptional regulator
VLCQITPAGEALLATLDPEVDATDAAATSMLTDDERRALIALLSAVRHR